MCGAIPLCLTSQAKLSADPYALSAAKDGGLMPKRISVRSEGDGPEGGGVRRRGTVAEVVGHAKGELGLSMTSEYAGRETLEAKRLRAGREVAQIGEPWGREGNQMATANELREALRDERARVADLRKRVQDNKYLRFCLVSASGVLHIVEHGISPATMAEPHVSSSPAWWLQPTADLLGGARAQVNFVEHLVAKLETT
jgi:hypothetical protein